MDWKERASVVSALTESLSERLGWCGETQLQKAVFLLQTVSKVELAYEFTLDRDGPFSFDLREDLALFRSRDVLRLEPQPVPYGPKYVVSVAGKALDSNQSAAREIDFVATKVSRFGAVALERLVTALFVTRSMGHDAATETRVKRFMELKPQVQAETARIAVEAADEIVREGARV